MFKVQAPTETEVSLFETSNISTRVTNEFSDSFSFFLEHRSAGYIRIFKTPYICIMFQNLSASFASSISDKHKSESIWTAGSIHVLLTDIRFWSTKFPIFSRDFDFMTLNAVQHR